MGERLTEVTENRAPAPSAPQTPAGLTASDPFVSGHGRAVVVVVLFAAYIILALFTAASDVLLFFTNPVLITPEAGAEAVTLYDLLQMFAGLGTFLVFVALVVAFLMWLHRVSKNLPALGNARQDVEYSPGWAVGSFFVPFVNLVVPYKAVREVWEKSDPAVRTGDDFMFAQPSSAPLVLGWWIFWIVSNGFSNIAWRLQADATPDSLPFAAGVDLVACVLSIIAALLAVGVVRGIDRRQSERARHVTYVGNAPPPPPVFGQPPPPAAPAERDARHEPSPSGRS